MFGEIGQMFDIMKKLPKIKEEMEKFQQRLGHITAEGDAGAGMVKVKVNGKMEILSCTIGEDAFKMNDREMLEDLIAAATNQAITKVKTQTAEEASKMASAFGIPAGLNLPGLSFPG